MSAWLPYVIGYGFAIVVGHFATSCLVDRLWISIGGRPEHWKRRSGSWLPIIVGLVERALYVAALTFCDHEFIGVWLVLKVATRWNAWKDGVKEGNRKLDGPSIFSIFLIGNGVSIGYAFVGFYLISHVREDVEAWKNVISSIFAPLALLAATVCLWVIAKLHEEKRVVQINDITDS